MESAVDSGKKVYTKKSKHTKCCLLFLFWRQLCLKFDNANPNPCAVLSSLVIVEPLAPVICWAFLTCFFFFRSQGFFVVWDPNSILCLRIPSCFIDDVHRGRVLSFFVWFIISVPIESTVVAYRSSVRFITLWRIPTSFFGYRIIGSKSGTLDLGLYLFHGTYAN